MVIFHGDCPDGFGGGFAAWKKFGARATYLPQKHGNPLPRGLSGKEVYVIDFAYPKPLMQKLVRVARRVVAIDHHEMVRPSALLAHDHRFDLKHSGAMLAWRYFHPQKAPPVLIRYIEDIDLWCFRLPYGKEVSLAVSFLPFEFKSWNRFVRRFENKSSRVEIIRRAHIMLEYEEFLQKKILGKAVRVRWHGKTHLAVNAPVFVSELGNELAKRSTAHIGIIWHRAPDGIRVSLRSIGNVDVAKLAAREGGGGHPHAAAFRIKKGEKLPWKTLPS